MKTFMLSCRLSLKGGPQDRGNARKQMKDLAVMSSNKDDTDRVIQRAATAATAMMFDWMESKGFEVTRPTTEPTNSTTRRPVKVKPVTRSDYKWIDELTGKKFDNAKVMGGVDEDGWEAVNVEEVEGSEYVLV